MTLMKQKEPKEPKRRIALIMNVLFYFCGLCIGGGIVRNLTLCYELGRMILLILSGTYYPNQ